MYPDSIGYLTYCLFQRRTKKKQLNGAKSLLRNEIMVWYPLTHTLYSLHVYKYLWMSSYMYTIFILTILFRKRTCSNTKKNFLIMLYSKDSQLANCHMFNAAAWVDVNCLAIFKSRQHVPHNTFMRNIIHFFVFLVEQ